MFWVCEVVKVEEEFESVEKKNRLAGRFNSSREPAAIKSINEYFRLSTFVNWRHFSLWAADIL